MEIKDRILKILQSENMSSARFADILGVQRSNISHILSGRNNPGLDFLQKVLLKFPSINPEWLIIGKGEMLKQNVQAEINFETTKAPPLSDKQEKMVEPYNFQETGLFPLINHPRTIKQIFVFYSDNTYEILNPENKKEN